MSGNYDAEGCSYCGELSCQEHFEREPEEKVAALLAILVDEGKDHYADVLESRGYGPDWWAQVGEVELLEGGQLGLVADGEKIVVQVRVEAA